MAKLVFKRRHRERTELPGQTVVKINNREYNKVLEIADETGLSIREVVSRLVAFAYENVEYEMDVQEEEQEEES